MKARYLFPDDYMADLSVHVFNGRLYISPSHVHERDRCVFHKNITSRNNAPAGIPQLGVYLVKSCLRFVHIVLWVFILLYHIFFLILQR